MAATADGAPSPSPAEGSVPGAVQKAPRSPPTRVYTDVAVVDLHGAQRVATATEYGEVLDVPVRVFVDAERAWFAGRARTAGQARRGTRLDEVVIEFPGAPDRLQPDLLAATRLALARQPDVLVRGDPASASAGRRGRSVALPRTRYAPTGAERLDGQRDREARRRAERLERLDRLMTEPELSERPSSRARQRARSLDAGFGGSRSGFRSPRGRRGGGRR